MPESLQSALSTLAAVVVLIAARRLERKYLKGGDDDAG